MQVIIHAEERMFLNYAWRPARKIIRANRKTKVGWNKMPLTKENDFIPKEDGKSSNIPLAVEQRA